MKYRFWDIETAPQEGFYWDARTRYIPPSMQEQCTTILMMSWKDSDEDKVHNIRVSPEDVRNDLKVVKKANDLLQECADKGIIIVHQNGDKFDYKKVRARNRFWRLKPLPTLGKELLRVDTLKESRKSGYDYHNLDWRDKHFHGSDKGKVETKGWLLWRDIVSRHSNLAKRKSALKDMTEYCNGDIICLERDFNTMLPDIELPNSLLIHGKVDGCPQCGGKDYMKRGYRYTKSRMYQAYQCRSCGKRFQDTESVRGAIFK